MAQSAGDPRSIPRPRLGRRHRPGPRTELRAGTRSAIALALVVLTALVMSGCVFDQPRVTGGARLESGDTFAGDPTVGAVAYGPDPAQLLDVYRPEGRAVGTIVYFHSGGWVGDDQTKIAAIVGAERNRGWAIVSAGYRLAPEHRAPELLADADRSLRYVRAHAAELGLDTSTVVIAGASAGGYLASMLAVAPGVFSDPALPPDLEAASTEVDGLLALVAPTDLETLWKAGDLAEGLQTALLGCSASGAPYPRADAPDAVPPCAPLTVRYLSPLSWARAAAQAGETLPPAYFAYGDQDLLVLPSTQGSPMVSAWGEAGGYARAWYDDPAAGHNLDHDVTKSSLDLWIDKVRTRDW